MKLDGADKEKLRELFESQLRGCEKVNSQRSVHNICNSDNARDTHALPLHAYYNAAVPAVLHYLVRVSS